jgi:hypothetical protein
VRGSAHAPGSLRAGCRSSIRSFRIGDPAEAADAVAVAAPSAKEVVASRLDEVYTRLPLVLGQAGWTEVAAIHLATLEATQAARNEE